MTFHQKRVISTPRFGDVIRRDRLELVCKFLYFTDNESLKNFQGPTKLFKIFPVISHLNNSFSGSIYQIGTFKLMNY
jgi:hypothetical protein